jgi:23S rRNA (adenine2503-C2)-methyltransferase
VKKWSFAQIQEYGERFYVPGDRKITLNFALAQGMPVDPFVLLNFFENDNIE